MSTNNLINILNTNISNELNNIISSHNNEINFINDKLESEIIFKKILENKILNLEENICELKLKINVLNEKNKEKSSSSIWESMNVKLQEKDSIIEELKKELEYKKRQSDIKNKDNVQNNLEVIIENKKIIDNDIKKVIIENEKIINNDESNKLQNNDIKKKKVKKVKKVLISEKDLDELEKELLL